MKPLLHVRVDLDRWLAAGLCGLLLAGASQAQNIPQQPYQESVWLAVSDRALDQLRGGFDLGAGLVVSFGIDRAVFINGQLMASTVLQIGDVAKLTSAQAAVLGQQIMSQVRVVQNGPGNTVDPGAVTVPLAMVIQNTLDSQTIRNQTVIQATTNGLGILRGLNLEATINESIARAIGGR
ncbi:hypothetical protein [Polaromonas jejuensis]|uniref:Uncharacterized protein n=1 Tax=Polaromonas jejuensis TaxID=457502 RepID=A0ABW0QE97_9BURK|nr:hypothetical protein [Polaromonas jejuensis]